MDTYWKSISGISSLVEISVEIRGQEVGYAKLVSSEIEGNDNTVTFEENVDEVPKPLYVMLATDLQPANTTPDWAGDMMVAGKKTAVKSYRKN